VSRRDLPAGTVTFLFTDVEGSTQLLHELGPDAYGNALLEHRRLLREAFSRHDGVEVDTEGDAFFVAFPTAAGAVAAAAEAQQALNTTRIRVRMGLHTGTPHLTGEGYVGEDVHLGARISAIGHGGQVLISSATKALVDGFELTDLGEHRLKDFADPVWIYQLGPDRFPPLKSISNTNLPRPASRLIGREKEVREIVALLRDASRLVTLTGAGGTGKTRLSIEAASELAQDFKNGTFWVELAPLTDPTLVSATISQTIGARDDLAAHIGERAMLLVLDNLEQVIDAAPEVARLVVACPHLRVLATSRERMRVAGETEYLVPPLARTEAVELFTTRSGLPPDDTVAELCRRLDDLPLAVELAAARASVLSPAQMLERLTKRLDLLRGGRDTQARQQTLRATIEWSHGLLKAGEQELFARLGIFAGSWTLEAAEDVAGADLDVLQSLVDKSLVRHDGERFAMLQTIREFSLEMLERSGQAEEMRRRHADHYLALAEEAAPHLDLHGDAQGGAGASLGPDWLRRLEAEHDNLRATFDELEASPEPERIVRLAAALAHYWHDAGYAAESRRHFEAALRYPGAPARSRAHVLLEAGFLAYASGMPSEARPLAEQALELYRQLGDPWGAAAALNCLVVTAIEEGESHQAIRMAEESVARYRSAGDEAQAVAATRTLAFAHHARGDLDVARGIHEANLARARQLGYTQTEAGTLGSLSMIAANQGRISDAVGLVRENLVAARKLGALHLLAQSICRAANLLALHLGKPRAASVLLGCFEAMEDRIGVSEAWVEGLNRETMARIVAHLDPDAREEARQRGRTLTLEAAAEYASAELGG
jgi:predicted ATPase